MMYKRNLFLMVRKLHVFVVAFVDVNHVSGYWKLLLVFVASEQMQTTIITVIIVMEI